MTTSGHTGPTMFLPVGLELRRMPADESARVLNADALDFLIRLARAFEPARQGLLRARCERQAQFDEGLFPDFLTATRAIRAADWRVAPPPADLQDRRVELVSTLTRSALLDALNCGTKTCVADFEDFTSPRWEHLLAGQSHLCDAARRTLSEERPDGPHSLADHPAALFVRPRGLHLPEKHVLVDGNPISAAFFDFAIYFFNNARELLKRGSGPYFYIPKLESHHEARLWAEIFHFAEQAVGVPRGTTKVTVQIESVSAAFEMEEILYELREHSVGLGCGSWDYVASFIRMYRGNPDAVLPQRTALHPMLPFLRGLHLELVRTCHKRGTHAIAGTSALLPVHGHATANQTALDNLYAEKKREAEEGFDGSWVAHPGLVRTASEAFNSVLPTPNQIHRLRGDIHVSASDLLQAPTGPITEEAIRAEIQAALRYLQAWLNGQGQLSVDDVLANTATVEIVRTQIAQWLRHGAKLLDDRKFSVSLFEEWLESAAEQLSVQFATDFHPAKALFERITRNSEPATLWAEIGYELLD